MTKRLVRFFLASLIAVNGIPAFSAYNSTPIDRQTVLQDWANALGMSGDLADQEIASIEYWGAGALTLNGQQCALTDYHANIKYQVPGMRVDFTCTDAAGHAHHEIQVVADRSAWNEAEPGMGSISAMGSLDQRLVELWTGPLALVKAASAAGSNVHISAAGGRTVVMFPVPGVAGATVKATLNARHQAELVETRLADGTVMQTTYADYAELNGSNFKFDTVFPHRIVQKQGGVVTADLTITKTSTSNVDLVLHGPAAAQNSAAAVAAPPIPPNAHTRAPKAWKNKQAWAKLDESLRETVDRGCVAPPSVIIRTKPGYRAGLSASLKQHGNQLSGEFPIINAVGASVSCSDLETVASFDSTLSVSANAPVMTEQVAPTSTLPTLPATPPTTLSDGQAAAALQAPTLQTLLGDNYDYLRNQAPVNGSIGIAIIDSGLAPGPDFGDRITAFYDFTTGTPLAVAPSDDYGHGTHVAGLAASRYVGVDPQAHLIGLKVLDGQGRGNSVNVLNAIQFAMMNKDALNIQVLNLSLGHPIFESAASDPLVQAVESAVRMGLVVVVSAGNAGLNRATGLPGYAGIASPGNAPSGFSVGAARTFNTVTRADDQVALFSSRGPTWYDGLAKPDFAAPGQHLLSVAVPGSTLQVAAVASGTTAGNYIYLSGTSMAAGVASGLAGLALQANPGLTPNALKAVLQYSAIPMATENYLTQGAGEVGGGAVALAQAIDSSQPVGAKWLTAAVTPTTVINGVAYPWAQRLLWGNYVAHGSGVIDEQRPAWAAATVWGDGSQNNTVWVDALGNIVSSNTVLDAGGVAVIATDFLSDGDNIVWGNNIVWGAGADDNIVWGNTFVSSYDDNIVWGNNLVWGNSLLGMSPDGTTIVWGNDLGDNIVWGNLADDNIVWGNLVTDSIVWGNALDGTLDNIVWGNSIDAGGPRLVGDGTYRRTRRATTGGVR